MCLLVISPAGETPAYEFLYEACLNNPDGFGWSMIIGNEIIQGHSMLARDAIDGFLSAREVDDTGWSMFHSRFATHGSETVDNCHPFIVGEDRRTVLAHNGILPIEANGKRSDTRVFAEDMLPERLHGLDNPVYFEALEDWLGRGNKVAIMTVNPDMQSDMYLLNESAGHWLAGSWWSNYSYIPVKPFKPSVRMYSGWGSVDDLFQDSKDEKESFGETEYCPQCAAIVSDYSLRHMLCEYCQSCLICSNEPEECTCKFPYAESDDLDDDESLLESALNRDNEEDSLTEGSEEYQGPHGKWYATYEQASEEWDKYDETHGYSKIPAPMPAEVMTNA